MRVDSAFRTDVDDVVFGEREAVCHVTEVDELATLDSLRRLFNCVPHWGMIADTAAIAHDGYELQDDVHIKCRKRGLRLLQILADD